METKLNIYGVKIIISSDKEITKWLSHDYSYYLDDTINLPDLKFNLKLEKPNYSSLPKIKATAYHDNYIIYDSKNMRIIDFFEKALVIYDTKNKIIEISCPDKEKLYEIFSLSFDSLLGEELDKRGFHRIHCLGLEKNGKAILVLLPPGGGKTTLALKFLKNKNTRVLCEDMLLFKKGKLYGLHFRGGVRNLNYSKGRIMKTENYGTKLLLDTKKLNLAKTAKPAIILQGIRLLSEDSYIKKINNLKLFTPLFKSMVLGLELQQSLAYFLLRNHKEKFSKANLGFSRLSALFYLLGKTKGYELGMRKNIEKNYALLEKFLDRV